jgi:intron-binding protein aquarius
MVVGPPGTGKTDTAVQIMHVLYHNCPSQRTLVIAHSNQALNDLFTKILERDVPARYLLRLGALLMLDAKCWLCFPGSLGL